MVGRTARDAERIFVQALQQAVSCVTRVPLNVHRLHNSAEGAHELALAGGRSVNLSGETRLRLLLLLRYSVATDAGEQSPWSVRVQGYAYALGNNTNTEILAYHWHPEGRSAVSWSHVHVSLSEPDAGTRGLITRKTHLPTGFVTLPELLRLAIAELGVRPLRPDWIAVLQTAATQLR